MSAALTIDQITARYGRLTVIDQASLSIEVGSCHAILGPNGAGKSTLLGVIAGIIAPTGGRILLDHRNITHASPARRSRLGVSRTFQTPSVWPELSALDNVTLAGWRHHPGQTQRWRPRIHRDARLRALHLLDRVGLSDRAQAVARLLSHGQRRLLDLAVALAGNPRLLLLDEPTAGLADPDVERFIPLLNGVRQETTVVLVEHRLDVVAALADRVTVLAGGRPLATGTYAETANNPQVQAHYPLARA
jgi:branched-chain amino acid transport system ATP-binding protein